MSSYAEWQDIVFFDKQVQKVLVSERTSPDALKAAGINGLDYWQALASPLIVFNRINGLLVDSKYSKHTDVLHSFSEKRLFTAELLFTMTKFYETPESDRPLWRKIAEVNFSVFDYDRARHRLIGRGSGKPPIYNEWERVTAALGNTTEATVKKEVSKFRAKAKKIRSDWQAEINALQRLAENHPELSDFGLKHFRFAFLE